MIDDIVRIKDPGLVSTILGIHDERLDAQVLRFRNISKVEWVQFLVSQIENDAFLRMWGEVNSNKVKYYVVATNAVYPPISKTVELLYSNFYGAKDSDNIAYATYALEPVKEWAREIGAIELHTFTAYPRVMSRYGFVTEDERIVSVVLPLIENNRMLNCQVE